jgi:hypothetical protein
VVSLGSERVLIDQLPDLDFDALLPNPVTPMGKSENSLLDEYADLFLMLLLGTHGYQ